MKISREVRINPRLHPDKDADYVISQLMERLKADILHIGQPIIVIKISTEGFSEGYNR